MTDVVTYELSQDVAVLRIDDGKVNALGPELLAALNAGLDRAEKESKAVLIVGRPGRFSAGFDLGVIRSGGARAAAELMTTGARVAVRIARHPAPVVIACTGHALAMGAVLLVATDLRIGATGDFKIGFNEVAIGMTTPLFLMELARDRLSKRHFLRATVQAEIYTPETAVDAGFLDRVTAPDDAVEAARREAQRLAELPGPIFCATRARARRDVLDQIEASLDQDVAASFPVSS